jgi:hypothetical protein
VRRPDIIVVGVGRTGTSKIAKLLHVDLGVIMAFNWHEPSEFQPEGSYEEQKMIPVSYGLVEIPKFDTYEWLEKYNALYPRKGIVGIKQTPLSLCTRAQWRTLSPKLVIRTYRPLSWTVESMMRWREPKNEDHWRDFYNRREKRMQQHLDWGHEFPVLRINFEERLSDNFLLDILKPWVKRIERGTI